jgi:hypothetical protein
MDRQLALVATVSCLVSAQGCKRAEQHRASVSDSVSTEEVSADIDRLHPSVRDESPAPAQPQPVGDEPRTALSRASVRHLSPERWLAMQAAAAWSGQRDRLRTVASAVRRDPSPSSSVEAPSDGEEPGSDEGKVLPDETHEEASTAEVGTPVGDGATPAESDEAEVGDEAVGPEEGTPSSGGDEELRRYVAATFGAGRGYTGVGAGDAGYTGMGAGAGFTGVGAGDGFTGVGAGPGFTGTLASLPSGAAASSRAIPVALEGAGTGSAEGTATPVRPTPIVVVWPVFVGPWVASHWHVRQ